MKPLRGSLSMSSPSSSQCRSSVAPPRGRTTGTSTTSARLIRVLSLTDVPRTADLVNLLETVSRKDVSHHRSLRRSTSACR